MTHLCVRLTLIQYFMGFRSLKIGTLISVDYKYNLWGLEEDSDEYNEALKPCHKRAAEHLLSGCLANGGLYVKLGQGLVSMNHILPREYLDTLVVLQDKALPKKPHDVSIVVFSYHIHLTIPK